MSECQVCGAVTHDSATLCNPCLRPFGEILAWLPDSIRELQVNVAMQARTYRRMCRTQDQETAKPYLDTRIPAAMRSAYAASTLAPTPLPVDLDAAELATRARNALLAWAAHHPLERDDQAGDVYRELADVFTAIDRRIDRQPPLSWFGPCDTRTPHGTCQLALYAPRRAEEIRCDGFHTDADGCGAIHTRLDRELWLLTQTRQNLVSVNDVLSALPTLLPGVARPRRDTVQAWIRRGRVTAWGRNHKGEPTFHGDDLLSLLATLGKPK